MWESEYVKGNGHKIGRNSEAQNKHIITANLIIIDVNLEVFNILQWGTDVG